MKKITLIFLSFVIYFNSITLANAAVGGWTMSNPIATGASTVYTGTKQLVINGADYIKKGTAKITPPATGVAKVLARGVAGYALSVAVEQLLGAVDWVLDPANNQIVYTKETSSDPQNPSNQYIWTYDTVSPTDACKALINRSLLPMFASLEPKFHSISNIKYYFGGASADCKVEFNNGNINTYEVTASLNPAYDPSADDTEQKTLPLDVVAQQVISNAESGDKQAQVATAAAAADMVAEAEQDDAKARPIAQQLEANATTKPADEAAAEKANEAAGEQTKNPDKPDTTDIKLTFPIFCNWAPTVCEAAQTVISFPKTLTNWWETGKEKAEAWATSISESWTEAKEWASSETKPEETDTEVDTIEEPLPNIDTGIFQASGQCPPDFSYPFPLPMGGTYTVTYSYATACYWFSKLYYIVVSVAWVIAFRIVTNTNTGNSENG